MPNPRVCLCGVPRSGTSMMMRVLQAGGLTIDANDQNINMTLNIMREPYGMFENRSGILAGQFVNTFKLLDSSKFSQVPSDYKFIFIHRSLSEIQASWLSVADRYKSLTSAVLPTTNHDNAVTAYNNWQAILTATPSLFLVLDYDTVCANPTAMASSVGSFINTSTFTFDEVSAAQAVDTNLYINRGA